MKDQAKVQKSSGNKQAQIQAINKQMDWAKQGKNRKSKNQET